MFARTTFKGHQTGSARCPSTHSERRGLRMRKTSVTIAVLGTATLLALTACSSSSKKSGSSTAASSGGAASSSSAAPAGGGGGGTVDGKGAKVGIILPDTTSSPRWITADPNALKADCAK